MPRVRVSEIIAWYQEKDRQSDNIKDWLSTEFTEKNERKFCALSCLRT